MLQTSSKYLFKLLLSTLIFVSIYSDSFPQVARTSYKILGVSVEGNKAADYNAILSNSGLKVNDEIQVPGDQTINAIKQLWSLNIFSDVQIVIDKQVGDGVFLLIKVQEYPRVEKVAIEGNDELSTSNIEAKINFMRGGIVKPQEVSRTIQKIKALYDEDGYLNASITPLTYTYYTADTTKDAIKAIWHNTKDLSDEYVTEYKKSEIANTNLIAKIKDRVVLKLKIAEDDRIVVRHIEFEGNNKFKDSDLRGEMSEISEAKWWKFWTKNKFDKKKYEDDKNLILKFYKKNGYKDAEILSDTLIYSNNNKDLTIKIKVAEGPQYRIRNITWEGNTIYSNQLLSERLDFAKGDVYNVEKFNQNLRMSEKQTDVASLYLDNGYLLLDMRANETKVGQDSVDINIQINEKNQFKIGSVDINGNDKTMDKVIRRELYTIPGDYFNRAALFRSLQQLANLQFFNSEKLYQNGADYSLKNDSTVNVVFQVEEKSSDYLNASVGYSGSYGFSGSVGVTLTNFSLAEPFQMGAGQILSFNWQFGVGNYYRTFSLGFTEPWFMNTPTLVGCEIFDTRQSYIYEMSQTGASFKVGRRLKWPDDYFYIQGLIKYQYNDVTYGSYYYNTGISRQFTLGLTISRKNVDNPIFPSLGSSVVLDGELNGGPFLPGNLNFYKINFQSEWYKRLFNTNRIALYTSTTIGFIHKMDGGVEIPPFESYYMGGNGMVVNTTPLRGYEDRTVGPILPNGTLGNTYGGFFMTKYTAELRFAVSMEPMPLYLLCFAEAGNVFKDVNNADMYDLKKSVGVGARVMINPIGLIGFDLGYGFDRKSVDGNNPAWLFHFQFGKGF
mgnify:CR=1 FL=1